MYRSENQAESQIKYNVIFTSNEKEQLKKDLCKSLKIAKDSLSIQHCNEKNYIPVSTMPYFNENAFLFIDATNEDPRMPYDLRLLLLLSSLIDSDIHLNNDYFITSEAQVQLYEINAVYQDISLYGIKFYNHNLLDILAADVRGNGEMLTNRYTQVQQIDHDGDDLLKVITLSESSNGGYLARLDNERKQASVRNASVPIVSDPDENFKFEVSALNADPVPFDWFIFEKQTLSLKNIVETANRGYDMSLNELINATNKLLLDKLVANL
jgi:hypothetical protein